MGVPTVAPQVALRGRGQETAALEHALATARGGGSAVLVIRGEAGIGKTALLDHAAGHATGLRTLATTGIESEAELPYAGLHSLCAPLLGRLHDLPGPQREALAIAFGLRQGEPPNPFLVGLAALSLLAGAAERQPMLCLIDDAQWLDEESRKVLAFVARRLLAERIALIIPLRDDVHELADLPELMVTPLGEPDARALLESAVRTPIDPPVKDRIVAEAHGNPMALLCLPRTLTPVELAGGFWLPSGRPLTSRL